MFWQFIHAMHKGNILTSLPRYLIEILAYGVLHNKLCINGFGSPNQKTHQTFQSRYILMNF